MQIQNTFSIINTTKGRLPSLPFVVYKNKILGKQYDLSLVFIDEKKMHTLNKHYRNIDSSTDILSFSLDKNSGEIFICQKIAHKKAKDFEMTYEKFIPFLFIHGLVHLLGYDHGNKMELVEKKYRRFFLPRKIEQK
jgi:probable rRNA maturation factor